MALSPLQILNYKRMSREALLEEKIFLQREVEMLSGMPTSSARNDRLSSFNERLEFVESRLKQTERKR